MKRVVILGSTGSIGESALRVASELSSRIEIAGLAVERNYVRVLEQAAQFGVGHIAVADMAAAESCTAAAPAGIKISGGDAGLLELCRLEEIDLVLCSVVGIAGLAPVMEAVTRGINVALATKEVLVAAGHIVSGACRESGARLLPVDSEHSAIFQCIGATNAAEIGRILLTASGGPFSSRPELDLERVTAEEALKHPRWEMGKKVTVDSATLMNKGLEIMEARWLFDVAFENIEVLIHPESIVHSLVEFVDGSVLAQLSLPDMRHAIQYALTYPERVGGGLPRLDLKEVGVLHFGDPDPERFPCLGLAMTAARTGGSLPAALNAANEVAVKEFLGGRIVFSGIWRIVEGVMSRHDVVEEPDMAAIVETDEWARGIAAELAGEYRRVE